jgi:sugar/nucleoside kinase (ribokinase family)
MAEILTVGEILVEIMREKPGVGLDSEDIFIGPFPSGAPANFIDAVANLGHSAAIVGGVGNDDFGQICLNRFKKDGVEVSGINISNLTTGVAFVAYFDDGSRKFIFHISNTASSDIGSLSQEEIAQTKIFHVMGCSLMITNDMANRIIEYAEIVKSSGGKISFDPNIRVELMNKDFVRNAVERITKMSDIILPGLNEMLLLADTDNKNAAIQKLLNTAEIIVLKQGSNGCEVHTTEMKEPISVPAFKIDEVDPTGAGDAFDAGFLCGLLEEKSFKECGILANACGALNTTRLGPMEGVFKRKIVEGFIKDYKLGDEKRI